MRFNAIFSYSRTVFCRNNLVTNQICKLRFLVRSLNISKEYHSYYELPHEMSQMKAWECAMFVSQYCSTNMKTSVPGSILQFKKNFLRYEVDALAMNVEEARGQNA